MQDWLGTDQDKVEERFWRRVNAVLTRSGYQGRWVYTEDYTHFLIEACQEIGQGESLNILSELLLDPSLSEADRLSFGLNIFFNSLDDEEFEKLRLHGKQHIFSKLQLLNTSGEYVKAGNDSRARFKKLIHILSIDPSQAANKSKIWNEMREKSNFSGNLRKLSAACYKKYLV